MYRVTDVVKHLLILNVLMYLGTMLLGDPPSSTMNALINEQIKESSQWGRYRLAMFFPSSPYFNPIQLVSHMFMHADIGHLFFNMFALFMFGPPIESRWGPKRFLFYYLFAGFGALALHMLVAYLEVTVGGETIYMLNVPMLGASGAIFGLLAAFGWLYPNAILQLIIPPIPMKAKYFVLIYAGLELFLGFGRFTSGVAHFAHIGGALFGFLLILYWEKFGAWDFLK